jgi:hypothetical protein
VLFNPRDLVVVVVGSIQVQLLMKEVVMVVPVSSSSHILHKPLDKTLKSLYNTFVVLDNTMNSMST